jgi:endonuclease YncB( thermonuclease family)
VGKDGVEPPHTLKSNFKFLAEGHLDQIFFIRSSCITSRGILLNKLPIVLLAVVFLGMISTAYAERVQGLVTGVEDGDVFLLSTGEKVKLAYVDAPGHTSSPGKLALGFTEENLMDKTVWLDVLRTDSLGRLVSMVYLSTAEGSAAKEISFNQMLSDKGLAKAQANAPWEPKVEEIWYSPTYSSAPSCPCNKIPAEAEFQRKYG